MTYHLGVDGLSLPLLVLNGLLSGIAIYSTSSDTPRPRFYYALILLLNSAVAGISAQDLLLFFLFYELELILYLLINIWEVDGAMLPLNFALHGSFGNFSTGCLPGSG